MEISKERCEKMNVNFNDMVFALSYALDSIEQELLGVETGHSKRVAYICAVLGKEYGLNDKQQIDLTACAALHDNALTQYVKEEYQSKGNSNVGFHCVKGEKNITNFPFFTDVTGAILFHHENANGSGPFRKVSEETPIFAQLIHFADKLDSDCNLANITEEKYQKIQQYLKEKSGSYFAKDIVAAFQQIFNKEFLLNFGNLNMDDILHEQIPQIEQEYTTEQIKQVALVFANIIDYKSVSTKNHSIAMAVRCAKMGEYYHYSKEKIDQLYIAGALHDIGKLLINNNVLEKPASLTNEEYSYMKNHAWHTYKILKQIQGFDEITNLASFHHERLDGSGYPFHKTADELTKDERLLECLDVYQALIEKRPYKKEMTHEEAIDILQKQAEPGKLDLEIIHDIDQNRENIEEVELF